MFLRSPMPALLSIRHSTSPAATFSDSTVSTSEPSAAKIFWPTVTLVARLL